MYFADVELPRAECSACPAVDREAWRSYKTVAHDFDFARIGNSMTRKPKIPVRCPVPTDFAEFMREVHARIVRGDKAAVSICSDDLLQCRTVYGGLYDVTGKRYGFRYLPSDDSKWDILLTDIDIASIACCETTYFDLWRCDSKECPSFYASEDSYCPQCESIRHFDKYAELLRKRCPELPDVEISRRSSLRAIGLALLDFHHDHGHFPPARLLADDGTPLHSWRSLILPYLDEGDLFGKIKFDEPWDSESNSKLSTHRPGAYAAGAQTPIDSCVVAVIGEPTIWPPSGVSKMSDINSGTSYTISAMLTQRSIRNWMQPTDIDVSHAMAEYRETRNILSVYVDGHVAYASDMPESEFEELLYK